MRAGKGAGQSHGGALHEVTCVQVRGPGQAGPMGGPVVVNICEKGGGGGAVFMICNMAIRPTTLGML